jgi:hypothetical protein
VIVRATPHEAIVAAIRAETAARLAKVPAPTIINIEAVLGIGAAREFAWQGRRYRAPPVPFAIAFRLLVVAHALQDELTASEPTGHSVGLARHLLPQVARPCSRWRRWGFRRWPGGDPVDILGLLWSLLDVPDTSPRLMPTTATTVDWVDNLGQFALAYPAAVDDHGLPRYWATYVRGMRHLSRARAREDLRLSWAVKAAGTDPQNAKPYLTEWRAAAGW